MSTTLKELMKAKDSLKTALGLLKHSLEKEPENVELHKALRDSCIQRFEFCVELSWKTSIKVLGLQTRAPNPAIRDMAQSDLISDPKIWFDFLEARNKTSHTYDEDLAQAVYEKTEEIVPELDKLIENLKRVR